MKRYMSPTRVGEAVGRWLRREGSVGFCKACKRAETPGVTHCTKCGMSLCSLRPAQEPGGCAMSGYPTYNVDPVEEFYRAAEATASTAGKLIDFQHAYWRSRRKPSVCQDAVEEALEFCGLPSMKHWSPVK